MPLVTGKITWRTATSNKTYGSLLTALRNFIVNSGNYTLVSDQITPSNYFVVRSTRNTGFNGDVITARVGISTYVNGNLSTTPYLYIDPWESWSGTTGTNGQSNVGFGSSSENGTASVTTFDLFYDTDIWVSCDTTFILSMSRNNRPDIVAQNSVPSGVVCFERLTGDNDGGTFYGVFRDSLWRSNSGILVPRRFDNVTGSTATYAAMTSIGGMMGSNSMTFFGANESGKHILLRFNVSLPASNKIKGRLFGVAVTTVGMRLGHGQLLPSSSSPQYIVGKSANNSFSFNSICMEVASTITTITT